MINLDDKHFMMIEPGQRTVEPVNDPISKVAYEVYKMAKPREGHAYKGFHVCSCGQPSDNQDWIMPDGRITNSLVVHYVMFHRKDIPRAELAKLLAYATDTVVSKLDELNKLKAIWMS